MKRITRNQGQRLCELIHLLRPDWHLPGIEAAIRKAADDTNPFDVSVAAIRAASDPQARTPGIIPGPGPHWAQTEKGRRLPPTRCHEHPEHSVLRCPECAQITPASPDQIKAIRDQARSQT